LCRLPAHSMKCNRVTDGKRSGRPW
jgi:hypothetical protein